MLFVWQNRKCKLSNIPLIFAKTAKEHDKGITTASLDRIDSSLGYIEGNIEWVHKDINFMKNTLSLNKFLDYCKLIAENSK